MRIGEDSNSADSEETHMTRLLLPAAVFTLWLMLLLTSIPPTVFAFQYDLRLHPYPEEGDECLICTSGISDRDTVLLYKGRRVPLCSGCYPKFRSDPVKHFAEIQARGAFFDEEAPGDTTTSPGWFVLGILIVLALFSAALCTSMAYRRGFPLAKWFFLGWPAVFSA